MVENHGTADDTNGHGSSNVACGPEAYAIGVPCGPTIRFGELNRQAG